MARNPPVALPRRSPNGGVHLYGGFQPPGKHLHGGSQLSQEFPSSLEAKEAERW